jgi:hypothetical protein
MRGSAAQSCGEKIREMGVPVVSLSAIYWPFGLGWDFEGDRHFADLYTDSEIPASPLNFHSHKRSFQASSNRWPVFICIVPRDTRRNARKHEDARKIKALFNQSF